MSTTAPTVDAERFHGRNRIASKAIRAVVSAVTATELGTAAKTVGVELVDDNGALAVTVSAPVRVASLVAIAHGRLGKAPTASVLERAGEARAIIRDRVRELTGSEIGPVNVRLTAARIEGDERVR